MLVVCEDECIGSPFVLLNMSFTRCVVGLYTRVMCVVILGENVNTFKNHIHLNLNHLSLFPINEFQPIWEIKKLIKFS